MQRWVIMKIAVVLGVLVGCATSQQPSVGWSGRLTSGAQRTVSPETGSHVSGESFSCGDTVLADQTTSGGERLDLATPCFEGPVVTTRQHAQRF